MAAEAEAEEEEGGEEAEGGGGEEEKEELTLERCLGLFAAEEQLTSDESWCVPRRDLPPPAPAEPTHDQGGTYPPPALPPPAARRPRPPPPTHIWQRSASVCGERDLACAATPPPATLSSRAAPPRHHPKPRYRAATATHIFTRRATARNQPPTRQVLPALQGARRGVQGDPALVRAARRCAPPQGKMISL